MSRIVTHDKAPGWVQAGEWGKPSGDEALVSLADWNLDILPLGTVLKLDSGEVAEVVEGCNGHCLDFGTWTDCCNNTLTKEFLLLWTPPHPRRTWWTPGRVDEEGTYTFEPPGSPPF